MSLKKISLPFLFFLGALSGNPAPAAGEAFGLFKYPPDSPGERRGAGMFDVSAAVVTPHSSPWARPLPGKRLRVLFIVPRWNARQVVEVAQRLDMDYRVLMTGTAAALSEGGDERQYLDFPAERPRDLIDRLERHLYRPYDLIAIGRFAPTALPDSSWAQILAQVRAGTGLFLTHSADERVEALGQKLQPLELPNWLTSGVPAAALGQMLDSGGQLYARAGRLGRGRVLISRYAPSGWQSLSPHVGIIEHMEDACKYDYLQSLLIRALLWTANRQPQRSSIKALELPAHHDFAASLEIRTELQAPADARARLRIRNVADREFFQARARARPLTQWNIPELSLPIGSYYADVWLLDAEGQVLDWSSRAFAVEEGQFIRSLSGPENPIQPGGTLSARIELARLMAENERLVLELEDFHGRLTGAIATTDPRTNPLVVELPAGRPLSLAATLRARLYRNDILLHQRATPVPVQQPLSGPGWEDFSFLLWGYDDEIFFDYLATQLVRDYGLDRILWHYPEVRPESEVRVFASRFNCRPFPLTGGGIWDMSHFATAAQLRAKLHPQIASLQHWGLAELNLGDECHLPAETAQLEDPRSRQLFQQAMQQRYGQLDSLNTSWSTAFTNWEDIAGISRDEAVARDRAAHYLDYRTFLDSHFADHFKTASRVARELFPKVRVGYENTWMTHSLEALDFWKLMQGVSLMSNSWTPPETEAVLAFKSQDIYLGAWNGSYTGWFNPEYQNWRPWYSLFHGQNGCWYWAPYFAHGDAAFGMYYPDLRLNPTVRPFLDSMVEIKRGSGKLILGAERQDYDIAIHYSQQALHADALDNAGWINDSVTRWKGSRLYQSWLSFMWGLQDGGLQYRVVAPAQIERGALADFRVLFLPFAQALSAAEAAAIRTFVHEGGTLIADIRPGVRDPQGRLLEQGQLDDLFGIRHKHLGPLSERADKSIALQLDDHSIAGTIPMAESDPAVALTDGKALAAVDGLPVLIEKKSGQGRAVLLNLSVGFTNVEWGTVAAQSKFQRHPVRGSGRDDTWVALLAALVAGAGIQPELEFSSENEPLRGAETATYHDGAARYYGVFGCPHNDMALLWNTRARTATGKLRQAGHLYDVRTGEYLGFTDTFTRLYHHADPLLLALLPYQPKQISITGPARATAGETLSFELALETAGGGAGRHVLRLEVFAPDGAAQAALDANVEAAEGAATHTLPLALNSVAGTWKITARDVASGATGAALFEVIPSSDSALDP